MAEPNPRSASLVVALKDYFGYKDGGGLKEFREEISRLSDQDKKDLATMLEDVGYTITNKP